MNKEFFSFYIHLVTFFFYNKTEVTVKIQVTVKINIKWKPDNINILRHRKIVDIKQAWQAVVY